MATDVHSTLLRPGARDCHRREDAAYASEWSGKDACAAGSERQTVSQGGREGGRERRREGGERFLSRVFFYHHVVSSESSFVTTTCVA